MENTISDKQKIIENLIQDIDTQIKNTKRINKVYYMSLFYSENGKYDDCRIMLHGQNMPKCPIDWAIFKYYTHICEATVVSSKAIRWMGNQTGFEDMNKKDIDSYKQQKFQVRSHLVLSDTLSYKELTSLNYFQLPSLKKYIKNTEDLKHNEQNIDNQYIEKNNIHIIDQQINNLEQGVGYLLKQNIESVMISTGPSTVQNYLENNKDSNLVDIAIITVYEGPIKNECFATDTIINLNNVGSKMKLIYQSQKLPQDQGFITFFVYQNKI